MQKGQSKKHTHFDLDPNAHPPFDKFMALMENNARFKKTFNQARKDLQDQSASSYDYSLAMFAVADSWTDDEIAALLISFRRKHSHDLKLNRSDNYYVRTISKARARYDENSAEKDFKQMAAQDMSVLGKVDVGSISRDEAITVLNERLNISIKRIVKYLTDPPSYRLEMQNGKDIFIPDVGSLIGQTALRRNVAAVANKYGERSNRQRGI